MTSSGKKVLRIPMKDHLRNSPQPTDVAFVFHVFPSKGTQQRKDMHDVVFPAHRDRLVAASPYFKSLLAGDWKHMDEVSIEDCLPGAFHIVLRWIYGEEAVLESIRPTTFVTVLLAADRFDMKELVCRLVGLAGQLITVTQSFFYKILDMMDHRQIGCANELTETCLKYFDKNAAALTEHACFLSISHEHLKKILVRDSLSFREIDLYRSATKWARAQLNRANKRRTHKAVREVLGEALFLIRFPTMHPQEFKNGPAKENVLSSKEKLALYDAILSQGPASCAFNAQPRTGASTLPLPYFPATCCQECGTRLDGGHTCSQCGCSYQPILICGACGVLAEVEELTPEYSVPIALGHTDDCRVVAYRCSCGAANLSYDYRKCECKRCGLQMWRCGSNGRISVGACDCGEC